MYTVSADLKTALESQTVLMKLTAQDAVFDGAQIKQVRYTASCCSSNIGIGNVSTATVEIELDGVYDLLDAQITVQIGTDLNGAAQYIPLGTFVVTECSATEDTTTITGYDAAYYAMAGTYVPTVASGATVSQVVADIAAQCGLEVDSSYIYDGTATVNGDLTGRTCRDMLGLMAMLVGRNAVITRDGKLRLVWFQSANTKITPDEYYEGEYTNGGETAMTGITCNVTKQATVTDEEGNTSTEETTETLTVGNDSNQITVENPFMTRSILDSLWLEVANYTYSIAECSFFGGLLVEPGDVLTVENRAGSVSNVPVMAVELSLDGGCKAKVSAYGQGTTQASAGGYLGPTEKKIEALKSSVSAERTAREQAVANLAKRLGESSTGLYQTTETQEDGSNIYYLHDRPTLDKSALVIKLTAGGIGISQDGGATWPYGFDFVTGDAIANAIYAGAAWIEKLFATEITATNLHIAGNSTFGGTLSSEVKQDIVDNLDIGGRNLILGTEYWDDSAFDISGGYGPPDGAVQDGVLAAPKGVTQIINTHYVTVSPGAEYTVSVDIKSTAAYTGNTLLIQCYDAAGVRQSYSWVLADVTADWTRISETFIVPDSVSQIYIGLRSVGGYANSYRLLKLEKGNIATDWTPAPEDMKAQLAEVQEKASRKNTVYYSAAQPTGDLAEGDIWFSTGDGGIYYYDGTSWVAHKVGTVSIADGVITADAIIASGVFAKDIEATGLQMSNTETLSNLRFDGYGVSLYGNASFQVGEIKIYDEEIELDESVIFFRDSMIGSSLPRLNSDDLGLDLDGIDFRIENGSLKFCSNSQGIKVNESSTSTASSSGWLLRGHIVSDTFCCNLGNTSDDTRLYGANLYRSGTSTSISSDRRIKKDFTDLDQRYDSFYKALKPCQFRFLDNTSGRLHTGFIAQEVETALEEAGIDTKDFAGLVIDSLDEDALAEQGIDINSPEWADKRQYYLRYEEFIALNTCMIQKLQARVEELERCSLGLKISKIARQIRKGWLKMKKYITALALALCLLATTATAVFRAESQTTKRVTYNEGISASEADYETYGNAVLEDTDSFVPDEENESEPEEPDTPDEPAPDVEEDDISNEEKIRTNLDPDSDVFYADVVCPGHIWEDDGPWDMEKPELGWFRFCLICGKTVSCDPPDDELESVEDEDICETSGNARKE